MGKAILTFICMFLSLAFGFDSYASEHLLPLEESEYQEIVSMRDEILFQMNHGGARAELGRDVQMDELGMERAYKIYSEPGLLKTEDPKKSLENSDYMWQIPVYTGHVTVLADITKVTPLPKDIPEDAEEMLKDDLNHWTVGAVYVYKNETVDYNEAVAASLEVAGYDSDKYRYEIVSGLPGIRYPAAVIFSADGIPEFIIPVQKATAHAFTGEWPTAAENRSTVPSLEVQDGRNDSGTSFPVYYYSDVARASNSWLRYGMGLSYKERGFGAGNISAVILGAAGVVTIAGVIRNKNRT